MNLNFIDAGHDASVGGLFHRDGSLSEVEDKNLELITTEDSLTTNAPEEVIEKT